jgi:CheY-like chemotaxis protein
VHVSLRIPWESPVKKIALLEDNPAKRELIQTALHLEGHLVFPYPDGDALFQALQILGDGFPYDVAIIDMWLPGSYSGQQVMRHLQQGYGWQLLPCIVVSALGLSILNRVQADFPDTPILPKPFKPGIVRGPPQGCHTALTSHYQLTHTFAAGPRGH